jgi:diguanylate cyclase (GGDEF)-like protein/PAS domain S-box-containing protein
MDDPGRAADEAELSDVDLSATAGERDFRAILQSAHEAFIAMDAGGFIVDWNPEAEATFGWSQEEAVGRVLADTIIPERHREAHWDGLQRYVETGEERVLGKRIEIDALHRAGHEFPVELTISVRRSGAGHFFNAFLHDISDRRRAALYVDAQHAVTRILAEADSEAEVIAGLLRELGERINWEYGAFWRMDEDAGRLVCMDAWVVGGAHLERFAAASQDVALEPGVGLPGRVWDSGRPALIVDVLDDDNFPRAPAAAEAGLHGALCFPLVSDDDRLGVIEFLTSAIGQTDEKLLDALASIGTQVGQHLTVLRERAELLARMDEMARTDELTGLPNRRAWDDELHRALARAQRSGEGVSVAVLDLDRFKDFNDAHGHPAGDQLLKQTGAAWPQALRATDFVARYGGEEFAVLLPACPPDSATAVVERIRELTPMGQTCSAGIAIWDREESAEELVARADAALYAAKRAGRDRIVLAEGIGPAG